MQDLLPFVLKLNGTALAQLYTQSPTVVDAAVLIDSRKGTGAASLGGEVL